MDDAPRKSAKLNANGGAHDGLAPERLPYHERQHGRAAHSPLDIGWRGWWDILRRVFQRIAIDNLGLVTAGVTFYIFLALIPAVIAVVSFYGIMTDAVTLANHVSFLHGYVPDQALEWIGGEIGRIGKFQSQGLTVAFALSLGLSLWSMNNAVVAWFSAMNVAYGEVEKRSTVGLYLRCFAFTLVSLIIGMMMIGFIVLLPLLMHASTPGGFDYGGRRVSAPALFVVVAVGAAAIYRIGPSRRPAKARWLAVGAIFSAVGWISASTLLSWYLSNIANYAAMYGSLGTIIALMFWLYISVYILMTGAWLNSEVEHQTMVDTTIGPPRPMGRRGAYVADTVGKKASR
ncbi:YihY/virulence factor BrkB family protein [Acuticoccus sp. MNP-M23]|uniref:YihY/virulence factor BrkB family protein n=1 Tax=Acuticoccus sp. MNP-M23 TaxID=3072793 RepID=UPI00281668E1|nr:YihY/virulence factor BrkB family protein [Acuticoccus sp. MNP-M23]WMS42083.1 YihY/virulence factor BrkB family protein [Acuticoccus sp. MNP-M23]